MPLHINDDDLYPTTLKVNVQKDHITERPRSEFTMLSYTVHALKITIFARESIDLNGPIGQAQGQEETFKTLYEKYEKFVVGLPPYFRLGSTVGLTSTGPMAAIPVQRWMLHQQLWSLFLRLHRASLSSQEGRASCQLLAQNIISTQAQVQARCAVCGSLSISETQLINAAIALLVDLLFSFKQSDADHSSAQLRRLMTRDKILEAIELLRTRSDAAGLASSDNLQAEGVKASAQRSVIALEALIKLEEEEFSNDESTRGANSGGSRAGGQFRSDSSARQSLKHKIMNILENLQKNAKNATAATEQASLDSFPALDMPMPLIDGFQDLDVLPVLSNDTSWDFWQFLDFTPPSSPTKNGSYSAIADSQTFSGSMPFMGTPESGDVYSSIGGTNVRHPSPSFIGADLLN